MMLARMQSLLLSPSARLLPAAAAAAAAPACRFASSAAEATFRAKDLLVEAKSTPNPALPEELSFGKMFTDHMLVINHTAAGGWQAPRILPFGPLQMHPAAQVLHYGTCCFEGMKAYAAEDGRLLLFRPELNMARLLRSAQRLVLAGFDPAELLSCIKALLRLDAAWVPRRPGHSMYIRPYMFSSDGALGVHKSSASTLAVIMSPVGPYFKSGSAAVRLFLDTANVRAWPGGPGQFKIGGNYAPTVAPQMAAMAEHQCSQVMYALPNGPDPLDATISECGAMNLFFVFDRTPTSSGSSSSSSSNRQLEVVTPPLDGTILPGVTRASVLEVLQGQPGVAVSQRELRVGELVDAHAAGRLLEVFGTGTACVVQPVGCVVLSGRRELALPAGGAGAGAGSGGGWGPGGALNVAEWARSLLTDIQYGRVAGHPWSVAV